MNIQYTKTRDVKDPTVGTSGSLGIDLYIPNDFKPIFLQHGEDVLIPSGLHFNIPVGYGLLAADKSGVATKKKLTVLAKVIDTDYQGEVHIHMMNVGKGASGAGMLISPGEKIVQLIIIPHIHPELTSIESKELLYQNINSERGEGAFGSTGIK